MSAAEITVVIPAYGSSPHLQRVIGALNRQTLKPAAVIIAHSGSGDPTASLSGVYPHIRILHQQKRLFAAAARNVGLAEVRTEWTAFLDSDVIPAPGWMAALHSATDGAPTRFVVGAVDFAVSGGYWGLCLWATEFSGVHPYLPDGEVQGGASANMLVRTKDIRGAGGFDERFAAGEDSLLAADLRSKGLCNWFCTAARVAHMNIPGVRHCLAHSFWLGQWSARCRRQARLRGAAAAHLWPMAFGLWFARACLVYTRVLRWGRGRRLRFLALAPGILVALLVWNGGFLWGLAQSRNNGR